MNQCDGCAKGDPVIGGMHIDSEGRPYMVCQKSKYEAQDISPGYYKIRTFRGSVETIKMVDFDGELGASFRLTGNFIPLSKFVGVEFLEKLG